MDKVIENNKNFNVLLMTKGTMQNFSTATSLHIKALVAKLSQKMNVTLDVSPLSDPVPVEFYKFVEDLRKGDDISKIKQDLTHEMKVRINELRKKVADFDIVHVQHAGTFLEGIWAKLFFGKKLVVTIHSLMHKRQDVRKLIGEENYQQCLVLEDLVCAHADEIIFTYKSIRDEFLSTHPSVEADKSTVIYSGIDIDEFSFTSSLDVLNEYNIDPTIPYVFLTGMLRKLSDCEYIEQFVKKLKPEFQVLFFLQAYENEENEGEYEERIKQIASIRPGSYIIKPNISNHEKIALYSHASVVCYSLIYEPSSFSILASLSCGTPVVCAAVGCVKEIVKHGESGFLIEPGLSTEPPYEPSDKDGFINRIAEATNRVLKNRALNRRLAIRSRESIEQIFSWEIIADRTIKIYQDIMARN